MKTEVGRFLAKLRVDNDENMSKMAQRVNTSASFLSAVENGKKTISDSLYKSILDEYDLSSEKTRIFNESVCRTKQRVTIPLREDEDDVKAEVKLAFAQKVDSLTEEQLQAIKEILNKKEG